MNLSRLSLLAATVLLLVGPRVAAAAPASPVAPTPSVPLELQPWIEWVKGVQLPPGECREVDEAMICVWPTRLAVSVTKSGGSFELEVTAHDPESVQLPGDDRVWPQDVEVDGKPAVVIDDDGVPSVRLAVGRHRVRGVFPWDEMPDSLAVPPEVALVDLKRDGKPVVFPARQEGLLRLLDDDEVAEAAEPEEDAAAETEGVEDALRLEVSRWLRDGVPLTVVTRVDLRVSGKPRELTLPYPLWDDAELLRVDSDLPLQFGEGRALVLQARSGSHTLTLEAALPRQIGSRGPPTRSGCGRPRPRAPRRSVRSRSAAGRRSIAAGPTRRPTGRAAPPSGSAPKTRSRSRSCSAAPPRPHPTSSRSRARCGSTWTAAAGRWSTSSAAA